MFTLREINQIEKQVKIDIREHKPSYPTILSLSSLNTVLVLQVEKSTTPTRYHAWHHVGRFQIRPSLPILLQHHLTHCFLFSSNPCEWAWSEHEDSRPRLIDHVWCHWAPRQRLVSPSSSTTFGVTELLNNVWRHWAPQQCLVSPSSLTTFGVTELPQATHLQMFVFAVPLSWWHHHSDLLSSSLHQKAVFDSP